ncbi:hypothetical protein N0V90_011321 [Kalmusia sp. IMI 367209]|nr:hypothetical protein N0V90_011321 [Kalmusia sp. IMI 367209]
MLFSLLAAFLYLTIAHQILRAAINLRRNIAISKNVAVPVLVRWSSPNSIFWLLFGDVIVRTSRRLGLRNWHFQRFYPGWEVNERYKIHSKLGDAFFCIAPGDRRLYLADHDACIDVLKRPDDFKRDMKKMSMMNLYGRHIVTVEGAEWRRFKKAASSAFSEKINEMVWRQTLFQADSMLAYWKEGVGGILKTTVVDCRTFTLNVLAGSLFSIPYPFQGRTQASSPDTVTARASANQYRDSLVTVTGNLFPILLFGGPVLRSWFAPKKYQRIGVAVEEFRSYVMELIAEERLRMHKGQSPRQGLISNLTRVCEDQSREAESHVALQSRFTMTENEIVSNVFMYTVGGTDTSATTLANAVVHLSAHPRLQNWLSEEIQHYLTSNDRLEWGMDAFPKLKRCRAVLVSFHNKPLSQ